MATERDFELLDDYIANRLKGSEKSAFENKLQADPDLQNEFSTQQNLVEGIKKARAAELKAMLQNVPIPAGPQGGTISVGVKAALTTVVAALVATGIYFYFQEKPVIEPEKTEQVNEAGRPTTTEEQTTPEATESASAVTEDNESVNDSEAVPDKQSQPATQPKIEVFDPSEENEETAVAADESPRTSADNGGSAMAVEIDKQHKQYSFHYQFRDGKLFLYGPFEKNLYEIMEFISDEKTTMFLFYKNNYYLLKEDGDRIKPLAAISDPALIGKLKEYRKNQE
jgi:hypothetical protein